MTRGTPVKGFLQDTQAQRAPTLQLACEAHDMSLHTHAAPNKLYAAACNAALACGNIQMRCHVYLIASVQK